MMLVIGGYVGLECILLAVCTFGDFLLKAGYNLSVKAAADSLTHGLVAGLSWVVVRSPNFDYSTMKEAVICMLLAMAVDLDHFIAAKSLNLKAATSLQSRPAFHCTTFIPVIALTLYLLCLILRSSHLHTLVWMFTLSTLSHHIRDAERRGLWLPPFGSTEPLPRWLYLAVTFTLPFVVKFLMYSSGVLMARASYAATGTKLDV